MPQHMMFNENMGQCKMQSKSKAGPIFNTTQGILLEKSGCKKALNLLNSGP